MNTHAIPLNFSAKICKTLLVYEIFLTLHEFRTHEILWTHVIHRRDRFHQLLFSSLVLWFLVFVTISLDGFPLSTMTRFRTLSLLSSGSSSAHESHSSICKLLHHTHYHLEFHALFVTYGSCATTLASHIATFFESTAWHSLVTRFCYRRVGLEALHFRLTAPLTFLGIQSCKDSPLIVLYPIGLSDSTQMQALSTN